jgi:hypothetical protein
MSYSSSHHFFFFDWFLFRLGVCLGVLFSLQVAEAPHQVVSELDYFLSLLLHMLSVALVGHFNHSRGCRWL